MTVAQAGFRGKEAAAKKLFGSNRSKIIMQLLLICSLFIKKQFDFLVHYDMGFNSEGIFYMNNILKPDPQSFWAKFGSGNWNQKIHIAGILSDFNFRRLSVAMGALRIRFRNSDDSPWSISVKIEQGADLYKVAQKIETAYKEYSGELNVEGFFVSDEMQRWYEEVKKSSKIMDAFTGLTILIMLMGVFAMSLYLIKQKEKEIAIRKVHGAKESQILLMLNMGTFISITIAFVIATPIAYYAITKWLENFAYKISLSVETFIFSGITLLLLTLLTVSWLTWRAARANPVKYLKKE
jgi:putative ABC transport system permease protein